MDNFISKKEALLILENQLKSGKKISISDAYVSIDKLPVFNAKSVKEQVVEEVRCIMDTYCGSMADDVYSELETLEQETIEEIFKACGNYGMRD